MTAQIQEIAATAANAVLLNPSLLIAPTVTVLAVFTGLAGRVAVLLEDLLIAARHNHLENLSLQSLRSGGLFQRED